MSELPKTYDPKAIEAKWYAWWLEQKHFHRDAHARPGRRTPSSSRRRTSPASCTWGMRSTTPMQDVLIRWKRMQGRNAVWVPGTDHAGIATQNVVERELKKEGSAARISGREKFVKRVWAWKEQYGSTIVNQLKSLGSSCDWDRERFTMDEGLSNAVKEVFVRLYDKGLIYRGKYIINWCPRCQTALSDEESEHREAKGKLYHFVCREGRAGRVRDRGDHAPGDVPRRHRGGGESEGRALPHLDRAQPSSCRC
jgi:valyl-tRNA synthetase